ncbi:Uncharacterised protein [Streptococcus pneumoniae]|nr:Uncharacterised protein [Streptococcus pneumoniae]CKG83262.1 Uncharacterised protein [Streptococcus pneumoniae]
MLAPGAPPSKLLFGAISTYSYFGPRISSTASMIRFALNEASVVPSLTVPLLSCISSTPIISGIFKLYLIEYANAFTFSSVVSFLFAEKFSMLYVATVNLSRRG